MSDTAHVPLYKPSIKDTTPLPDELAPVFQHLGVQFTHGNTRAVAYDIVKVQPKTDGEIQDNAPSEALRSLALKNNTNTTGSLDWCRGAHTAEGGLQLLNDASIDDVIGCIFLHRNQVIVKKTKTGVTYRLHPDLVATLYRRIRAIHRKAEVRLTGEIKLLSNVSVTCANNLWKNKLFFDPTVGGQVGIPGRGQTECFMQTFKLATPDGDGKRVIDLWRSGALARINVFPAALDILRDGRGMWRKIDFIVDKLKRMDWRMNGDGKRRPTYRITDENGEPLDIKVIIENDDKVGRWCVSFMYYDNLPVPGSPTKVRFRVRGKFYIKPIFLIECGSQSGEIGTNIAALHDDNNSRVGGSKEDTVGDGYTRVELTIYFDYEQFLPQFAHLMIPEWEDLHWQAGPWQSESTSG
jgi:hypothetical protein